MRKYIYFLLALCISAVVCSCSKKEGEEQPGNEPGKTEFIMMGGYEVANGLAEEIVEEQSAIILKAFKDVGFSDKLELILVAEDSAAVSKLLADKMKLVMSELEASPAKIKATILVKGVERKFLSAENDKAHPVSLFFQKNIGIVRGDISKHTLWDMYCDGRWVHNIRSEEYATLIGTDGVNLKSVVFGADTNSGAGGDYIYVWLDFTGYRQEPHTDMWGGDDSYNRSVNHFVWDDACASKYITDVICIYGGGEPQQITIDGRRYQKANRVADLNKKASGEYVYLYTTTDPVKGYEGYYLNTGYDDTGKCCRMLTKNSHFLAKDHLNDPFIREGHRFVERVVPAYWTNGTYADEMDTNKGHGGDFVRMILTYATKSAGY